MIRRTCQLTVNDFNALVGSVGGNSAEVYVMWERAERLHNRFFTITLDLPHRPRSTGPKKQNKDDPGYQSNHLHGHLSQLAIHFGYTLGEMKDVMKDDVPEWPREERKIGKRRLLRPVSEADVSVEVEWKATEWCHMIAAEEGIVLKED